MVSPKETPRLSARRLRQLAEGLPDELYPEDGLQDVLPGVPTSPGPEICVSHPFRHPVDPLPPAGGPPGVWLHSGLLPWM